MTSTWQTSLLNLTYNIHLYILTLYNVSALGEAKIKQGDVQAVNKGGKHTHLEAVYLEFESRHTY